MKMNILIVGNGFDLAHGLNTSYKHFLKYCENDSKIRLENINNGTTNPNKEFYENNLWLKHFLNITANNTDLGNTWIDLENEIYSVIRAINNLEAMQSVISMQSKKLPKILTVNKYATDFNFFKMTAYLSQPNHNPDVDTKEYTTNVYTNNMGQFYAYFKSPKGLINFLYDQLRDFTKAFERYLIENVLTQLADQANLKYTLQLPEAMRNRIMSFNYTNTCEKLYSLNAGKVVYVHGKANADFKDCNLVLGTHSLERDWKDGKDGIDKGLLYDLNVFQKYNQRHKYGTIATYQDLLEEITHSNPTIHPIFHIIGHSLDKTDHNILKYIFTCSKYARINIYYWNEEHHTKLIKNIRDIIGEAEVTARVKFIEQHDPKRGLLIPKSQ